MFNVGSVLGYLKLNTSGWSRSITNANQSMKSLSLAFAKTGAVFLGTTAIIEREFGKFDKAIRHATSVTLDLTQRQFKEMSTMALDASVQWNKAATDTAQAFYFLGSAGLTATEQMQTFNDTIMLSRAMGSELAVTVEGMVDIVRAFGLEFENSTNIADQLTKTVVTSNQMFQDLDKALSYASSTARLTNNTLAETNAMLGIMANAGIKGCYDDKTEVLTKRGWLLWSDVKEDDEFATRNPDTGHIEYQKASRLIRYHHKGKMYVVANRGIDLCVTPNHRMWVKSEVDRKFRIIKASEMTNNHQYIYETLLYPDEFLNIKTRPDSAEWIDYDGEVFCAEVPNHLLIVRRNGKIVVSGNSMAGTVLRRAMTNLMSPTAGMNALMYELGLRVYDTTGTMKPFIDIIGEISEKLVGASDAYKNMVFEVLFGRRAIAGQITLFNYGADALRRYADEIKNSAGTTKQVASKQMMAFTEVLGQLFREVQRAAIEIGEVLAPAIGRVSDRIRHGITRFREYVKQNKAAIMNTMKWTTVISGLLVVGGPLILMASGIATAMIALASVIANPFIILIATLYALRAEWKQSATEIKKISDDIVSKIPGGRALAEIGGRAAGMFGYGKPQLAPTPRLGQFAKAPSDFMKLWRTTIISVKAQLKEDLGGAFDFINNKILNTDNILGKFLSGLKEYTSGMRDLFNTFMYEPSGVSGLSMPEYIHKAKVELIDLNIALKEASFWSKEWATAMDMVFEVLATEIPQWSDTIVGVLQDIQSEWANTMESFLNNTAGMAITIENIMEEMFLGILRTFNRVVSEIAANEMIFKIFGGGREYGIGRPGLFTGKTSLWSMLTGQTGGMRPRLPQLPLDWMNPPREQFNPREGFGQFSTSKSAGGTQINITNNGNSVNLRETGRRFDGRQWVISMVMDEISVNPSFAKAISGGG